MKVIKLDLVSVAVDACFRILAEIVEKKPSHLVSVEKSYLI